jgi:rhodanese-related sulfurtransferase
MSDIKSAGIVELQGAIERREQVVDVRERNEFDGGHVPSAVHIPMSVIPLRMDEITKKDPVWLICESGNRSGQMTRYLTEQGFDATNVDGGTAAWRASGLPIEK